MDWAMLAYGMVMGGVLVGLVDLAVSRWREGTLKNRIGGLRGRIADLESYIDQCHVRLSQMAQLHNWAAQMLTPEQLAELACKVARTTKAA